ncbi:MAG: hypothetical protein COW30_04275 [Rhodospirillales bacterium CG15_BIG_FIL_POST_REV_8_21_14_020_66_15]|nr:MAG: hypothetical protein COW30_04275 [Rhodospirillales bacterium CG15_BIG_FIL_POST_REV_8_21_14_020_66_15]
MATQLNNLLEEDLNAGAQGDRHAWDQPKKRSCLRCDTLFMSTWSGERICPRCKGSSAWRNDAPLPNRS